MLEIINKNICEEVKTYYNKYVSYKQIQGISVLSFLKKNKNVADYVNTLNHTIFINNSNCEIVKLLFAIANNEIIEKNFKCIGDNCTNILSLTQVLHNKKTCSTYCKFHNKARKDKILQTLHNKYGENISNVFQAKEVKNKIKQTNLKRYGTEYATQAKIVKDKQHKTNIEKYGNKCSLWGNIIHQKTLNTLQTKYNVNHIFKSQEIKNKIKQTNLKKYGVENPQQNKNIQSKTKQTNLKKYGVENPQQNKNIQNKTKQTIKEKYQINNIGELAIPKHYDKTWETILSWKNYVIPMFTRKEYKGYKQNYRWKCVKCNNVFIQPIYSSHNILNQYIPRCYKCYPKFISVGELELFNFCKQYFNNIIQHDKQLIKPYELDIVIPNINLAIEFNGTYYHSLEAGTKSNYHLMKTQMCEAKNYRLIHIWEHEWLNNKNIIKQKLINIFFKNDKIDQEILNRCWYSIKDFNVKEIIKPEIISYKDKYHNIHYENCGYFKIIK